MRDPGPIGAWGDLPFFATHWPVIAERLDDETRDILPPRDRIFAALHLCQPDDTKVVILGQDPYPTPGHADGLAFSATTGTRPFPRSLYNIFKELRSDLGTAADEPDLEFWARQGVLLLNTVLTVPAGAPRGHARLGWDRLTAQMLRRLDARPRAALLWGNDARRYAGHLAQPHHLMLTASHPSPLSARRGFFGSRPFSSVNHWLKARGETPIDWAGKDAS